MRARRDVEAGGGLAGGDGGGEGVVADGFVVFFDLPAILTSLEKRGANGNHQTDSRTRARRLENQSTEEVVAPQRVSHYPSNIGLGPDSVIRPARLHSLELATSKIDHKLDLRAGIESGSASPLGTPANDRTEEGET
ncbi:MAG: hypothetical protein EOP84_14010 [Verrucomicrobiaceae bacterium]|nr:MAG: hypothetical protein EOP84_14010 [Verrucomicrobiaceae bacterium]